MIRRSHRRSFGRSRGSRRRKEWERAFGAHNVPGNIVAGDVLLDARWIRFPANTFGETAGVDDQIEAPQDYTLIRMLNYIQFVFKNVNAGNTGAAFAAAGVLAWEQNTQDDVNPLEVPIPTFGGDADWIWTFYRPVPLVGAGAGSFLVANNFTGLDSVESRARRKLSSRQGLLLVTAIDNTFGTDTLNTMTYGYLSRGLFLEP